MSFRPTPVSRVRQEWARRQPRLRTVQRATTVTCLALGTFAGINTIASSCSSTAAVSATQVSTTINRASAVDGFADAFVNVYLSGAGSEALSNYTSVHVDPSPVPVVVLKSAPWSTQHADSGFGNIDLWSVVVGAFVKPVGRAPQIRHYQVPVAVIDGTLRAVSAPALVNGPTLGFDPELAYPQQLGAGNDLYDTVAGFLSAWLTGGGDLQRYSASPNIHPFSPAPFTQVAVSSIAAGSAIPVVPAEDYTARILVNTTAQDADMATTVLSYPLTVSFRGGKWFITDIDLTPKLGGRITPVTASPTPETTPRPAAWTSPR